MWSLWMVMVGKRPCVGRHRASADPSADQGVNGISTLLALHNWRVNVMVAGGLLRADGPENRDDFGCFRYLASAEC